MPAMKISELNIYPVKGCRAISVQEAVVRETGFLFDRHWLAVTADSGRFFSQRNEAKLALVQPSIHPADLLSVPGAKVPADAALTLTAPSMDPLTVPLVPPKDASLEERQVVCWEWKGMAQDQGDAAAAWFTKVLGKPTRLVRFLGQPGTNDAAHDMTKRRRPLKPAGWGPIPGHEINFADRLPYLMTCEASLAGLNKKLGPEEALPMNRFRPNLVVAGTGQPFEEDAWEAVLIEGPGHEPCKILCTIPCDRCKVTTTNQETLEVRREPLATLSTFRTLEQLPFPRSKFPNGAVFFGWLCLAIGRGVVSVGDTVKPVLRDGPVL